MMRRRRFPIALTRATKVKPLRGFFKTKKLQLIAIITIGFVWSKWSALYIENCLRKAFTKPIVITVNILETVLLLLLL